MGNPEVDRGGPEVGFEEITIDLPLSPFLDRFRFADQPGAKVTRSAFVVINLVKRPRLALAGPRG
jgi:hypothetical protein